MKPWVTPMLQKHRGSGIVRIRIKTQRGNQWLSTGQTSYEKAREVMTKSVVDKLQVAACADILTHDAISRLLTGGRFTCADILQAWREEIFDDLSAVSFNSYEVTLRQWMEFGACASLPLSAVKRCALARFVNEVDTSVSVRKGRMAALKSFYAFAQNAGYCVGNMAERVRVKTEDILLEGLEVKRTVPMTEDDYRLLMTSPRVPPFWRWATALSWHLGLRLKDVACLEVASLTSDTVIVWTKKTGARIAIPVDDPHVGGGELRAIVAEIIAQTPPRTKFCFPEKREVSINPKRAAGLSVSYQNILRRLGITGKRFHSLRHANAQRLRRAGLTLAAIGKRLGHADEATTAIYADHE